LKRRVFVIGIDGGSWKLMAPLLDRGELPNIGRLRGQGASGVLESTLIPLSPCAWTSFATGVAPPKHGIFDFSYRKKGSYESMPVSTRDRRAEPIWNTLSRAGKKVGIINVPLTYPVDRVNGYQISGFPTLEELGDFTFPRSLLAELKRELGSDFRLQPIVAAHEEEAFLGEVRTITDNTYRATAYLMKKFPWDLLMTVFVGPDALGHTFFRYLDPKHPGYRGNAPKEYKEAIGDIYKRIDAHIGELLKSVDERTVVLMMSDHGFGPSYYGVTINNWLLQKGYLTLKEAPSTRLRRSLFKRGVNYSNLFKALKALNLTSTASKAAYSKRSRLKELADSVFLTAKDIDWARTKAFSWGNGGQMFINLHGREPEGIVEPGRQYDGLVVRLVRQLKELKDPATGKRIFDGVYGKGEVYPGTKDLDLCPDIFFFDRTMRYSVNRFFEFGSKELISPHPIWSGTHTHDGIFLAHCPGDVKAGLRVEGAGICDMAPTIMHILGLPVPEGMDGHVLSQIFEKVSREPGREVARARTEGRAINECVSRMRRAKRL